MKGFTWNWVSALGVKNYNDGATGPRKKFYDIFSHLKAIHKRDRRTDGQTPDDSKDCAYA